LGKEKESFTTITNQLGGILIDVGLHLGIVSQLSKSSTAASFTFLMEDSKC